MGGRLHRVNMCNVTHVNLPALLQLSLGVLGHVSGPDSSLNPLHIGETAITALATRWRDVAISELSIRFLRILCSRSLRHYLGYPQLLQLANLAEHVQGSFPRRNYCNWVLLFLIVGRTVFCLICAQIVSCVHSMY
jgi:hypothetical protein